MTFHFLEERQHSFVLKFHIHYLEWDQLPLKIKPYSPYVKKDINRNLGTETEPPFAKSFKGASHALNHITPSPPFPKTSPGGTRIQSFLSGFNPFTFSPINTSRISKSPQEGFLLVWSSVNYFPVHQPAATNFMHFQSTYTLQVVL